MSGLPCSSGAIGLMSNDRNSVQQMFEVLLSAKPWTSDIDVLELPWRPEKFDAIQRRKHDSQGKGGRLVFGIMHTDGHVNPHPSIKRALKLVAEALRRCGHETVEWKPPSHAPAVENLFKIFGSTSAVEARGAINASGEPPVAQLKEWYEKGNVGPSTTSEFWDLCEEQARYRQEYAAYWQSMGSATRSGRKPDGVILPVAPTTAVRHGEFHYFAYSAIANALDCPAGTIPVTRGHRTSDKAAQRSVYINRLDETVQKTCKFCILAE